MTVAQLGWLYDRRFLLHDTGPEHVESPQRLTIIRGALEEAGLLKRMAALEFEAAEPSQIAAVHEPAYVELVRLACEHGMPFLGSEDTRISRCSFEVASLAAGAVIAACAAVIEGRVRRAFCAVRPPGHHAERDLAGGFCLFNNVAIGAQWLIDRGACRRIAIVDFDVHHGNGTQHIFEERADVLYISIHEHPGFLYPGTGYESERGRGAGLGFTLNVPLRPGSGDAEYRDAFERRVLPSLNDHRPDFLLLSAGFDAAEGERIAHMQLQPRSFGWMTHRLVEAAAQHCDGRLVSVLEGGYDPIALGPCVVEHVQALMPA